MKSYYLRFKRKFNYLLDRGIDVCDSILLDTYRKEARQTLLHRAARRVGDVFHLLKEFPRLTAWEFTGEGRRVVFVGDVAINLESVDTLLFSGEVERRELARVSLWNLPRQTSAWLADGVDLVVCELSRAFPYKPDAPVRFEVPTWVKMVVPLPDSLDDVLAGNKRKRIRKRVHRGLDYGFKWYFSRDEKDLQLFHQRMYRPFIAARHGTAAALSNYEHHRDRYFERGGLVMVTLDDQPVAGVLCYIRDGVFYSVEGGVLDADPDLMEKEVNGVSDWYSIMWAHQQGVRLFDMGGTRALRSNGIYRYKYQWGAQVGRRHKVLPQWIFLTNGDKPEVVEHLNQLGFVSEVNGSYYGVHISPERPSTACIEQQWKDWQDQGVSGIMLITPGRAPILHPKPQTAQRRLLPVSRQQLAKLIRRTT